MAATTTSIVFTSEIIHVGAGNSMAPAAFMASSVVSTALAGSGNLARYPLADMALMITCSASIAAASQTISVWRRDLNFDGTNDEKVPDASNLGHLAAVFTLPASTTVSTTHYATAKDVMLPGGDCEFYLRNDLGVNVLANWTLKITPKSTAQE